MYKMMFERFGFSKKASFFLNGSIFGMSMFAILSILSSVV